MSAPLWAGPPTLLEDGAVRALVEWSSRTLGDELGALYRNRPTSVP
jgi:hypothetical protein